FFIPIPQVEKPRPPAPQKTVPQSPAQPSGQPQSSPGAQRSRSEVVASMPPMGAQNQLEKLNQKLKHHIAQAWQTKPAFAQDLIYRIGVDQAGKIVSYQFVNQAAVAYAQAVPLPQLLEVPVRSGTIQLLSQFRVVFTPAGVVQVSPWRG
ncbi:MAG TPA: hypothetical protein V6D03_12430, partial [Candidatus Caenarcaniphilales bacterium]